MILDGKRLTDQKDVQFALKELKEKEDFKKIVESLQKITSFNLEHLDVKLVYIFDTRSLITGELATGEMIIVRVKNNVQIYYVKYKDQNGNILGEDYTIEVSNKNGYLEVYSYINKMEHLKTFEINALELFEKKINDKLIENNDFVPFSSFIEQDWGIPFCLIGYNHCGPGCGDGLTYGGGIPANGVDNCCRAHDRCWSSFGNGDPCCDKILVDCAKANSYSGTNAAGLIVGWFTTNANRC
ncbi:hypothetical protein [Psychrobacillus sp. MER TA 171]|uniref:hypothetical protein n=1 Tax=Psychrobacillus sp. MER TA 171 TaxID=2939577 RepID=UPI00203B0D5A|nr:hypothetical protein [Psychrobacillus sp. MER TA 171]MCM3358145.1 hypothetical protein [Psychrobacillus sp. MER TA 171]